MKKKNLTIDINVVEQGTQEEEKKVESARGTENKSTSEIPEPNSNQRDDIQYALFNKIALNEGITKSNYYATWLHAFVTNVNLTMTTTLQPLILLNARFYAVSSDHIGLVLAQLVILQTITKILFTPVYGFLIDKLGRKPMLVVGAIVCLLGYVLVPFQKTVYPGYALSKLLVANGGNIIALMPFNADYVQDKSKGKATGISQALGSGGSFLGSVFITILLAIHIDLAQIHAFAGVFVFITMMTVSFFIKGGNYYLKQSPNDDEDFIDKKNQEEPFLIKLRKGFHALRTNGWLLISLIINTLARADLYIITVVFALWMKKDVTPQDQEVTDKQVSFDQNIFFGLGMMANIFYGLILDRVHPIKIIFPTIIFGMTGYFLIFFAENKDSPIVIILMLTAGLAMPGLFNSANYLAIKNYPKELRGILTSLINVFGIGGYLLLSTIGGYYFDKGYKTAHFMMFMLMMATSLVVIITIYMVIKKKEAKEARSL